MAKRKNKSKSNLSPFQRHGQETKKKMFISGHNEQFKRKAQLRRFKIKKKPGFGMKQLLGATILGNIAKQYSGKEGPKKFQQNLQNLSDVWQKFSENATNAGFGNDVFGGWG